MRPVGGGEADVPNVIKHGIFYGALEKFCDLKPSTPRKRPKFIFTSKKRGVEALEEQKGESMPKIGVVFTGVSFCYNWMICDMCHI